MYGRTRKEARERLDGAKSGIGAEGSAAADQTTVGEYLQKWITNDVPGRVGSRTLPSYEQKVRHLRRLLGSVQLRELTPIHVEDALVQLVREGRGPGGVRGIKAVLNIALNRAMREGRVSRNAAALASAPSMPRRRPTPFRQEEVRAIRRATGEHRLVPFFFVGLTLGLRQGEAAGLRWGDVDLDAGTLVVEWQVQRAGTGADFVRPKTDDSRATLELTPRQVRTLRAHRRVDREGAPRGRKRMARPRPGVPERDGTPARSQQPATVLPGSVRPSGC